MRFEVCPNCGQSTGFKRHIGVGTLIGVLFTLGWWLLVVLFYPLRCIRCGYNKRMSAWQKTGLTAVCAIPILIVSSLLLSRAATTRAQSFQPASIAVAPQASAQHNLESTANETEIPGIQFVGCASDGQTGPVAAPIGQAPKLLVSAEDAAQLAWYQSASSPGVLAPRDWNCFGTYGSGGATLYISPNPIESKLIFSDEWKGFDGAAIEISTMDGGTSGRFEVARTIARLFPEHLDFVRQVSDEGLESNNFTQGPFSSDNLTYKSRSLVEFETPADTEGLGTQSKLIPSNEPISGFVFLSMQPNDDPYDISVEIRLPPNMARLKSTILSSTEHVSSKNNRNYHP